MSKLKPDCFSISDISSLLKEKIDEDEDEESLSLGLILDSEPVKKETTEHVNPSSNEGLNLKLIFKETTSTLKSNQKPKPEKPKTENHKTGKPKPENQKPEKPKTENQKKLGKELKKNESGKEITKSHAKDTVNKETSKNTIKREKAKSNDKKNEQKKIEIGDDQKEHNKASLKETSKNDSITSEKESQDEESSTKKSEKKTSSSKPYHIKIPYRETDHIPSCLFEPDGVNNSEFNRIQNYNVYIHETTRVFSVDSACRYVFIKRMSNLDNLIQNIIDEEWNAFACKRDYKNFQDLMTTNISEKLLEDYDLTANTEKIEGYEPLNLPKTRIAFHANPIALNQMNNITDNSQSQNVNMDDQY